MIRRLRPLAGLLGLLTLGFTISEGALAGSCAPGELPMAGMTGMRVGPAMTGAGGAPDVPPDTPCDTMHGSLPPDHQGPRCPLAQLGSLHGCGPGASVAPAPFSGPAAPAERAAAPGLDPAPPTLLFATPLFHPPRA